MEDTQSSDAIACHIPSAAAIPAVEPESSLNKRRGICSSVELGLDKIDVKEEASLSVLCQKLVNAAEVKQLVAPIESRADKVRRVEKRESDYIDSKQSISEVQSSDGTPSEVLSAHDYENICAVNIARETWGLRSWRGYSDIETWLHDDSVVRDRTRDTILSVPTMVSGASSERSTTSESPPLSRQWESVPPLPNRRPRPSYNRMDDYLDTLAYDLAEIERRESNLFVAQPYVVDQNGLLYPLPPSQLDTIMEELEESSCTSTASVLMSPSCPGWASSLVATIDEIRTGTNDFDDAMTVSENDFDVGSYHSLQFDTSIDQHMRFSYSLPSLLQAPRSWSQLTPEKLVEQELRNSQERDRSLASQEVFVKRGSNRPRRKVSLLREKFDKPTVIKETIEKPAKPNDIVSSAMPDSCEGFNFKGPANRQVENPGKLEVYANADVPGRSQVLSLKSSGNRRAATSVETEVFIPSDIPGESQEPSFKLSGSRQLVNPEASDIPGGRQSPSLISAGNREAMNPKAFVSSEIPGGSQVPSLKTPRNRQWNSYMKMQNQCNAHESPVKQDEPRVDPFCRPRGKSVLKRVLTPPRLHYQKRTLVIASNASA